MRSLEDALVGYPRTIGPAAPVIRPGTIVIRCERCAHQDHARCQGSPQAGTCHCRQCFTRLIAAWYQQTRDTNDPGIVRAVRDALFALQLQTMTQKQRKAARAPGVARCSACGAAVPVRRRPSPGQPVYCRDTSRCRMRALRGRQRAEAASQQPGVTVTAGQIPLVPAVPGAGQDPAGLWLALHR